MKGFYIRWCAILAIGLILAVLGFLRYERDVMTLSPEELLSEQPGHRVRLLGTVEPGTLVEEGGSQEARFQLMGNRDRVPVIYKGKEPENLRELKTLVAEGRWDPVIKEFQSDRLSVIPNFGFVVSAYLVAILPLIAFLFGMERNVRLLYHEIKGTTVYEPEKVFDKE